nr:class I SAM-dependent methyltransferase [Geotalea sp. SG265]
MCHQVGPCLRPGGIELIDRALQLCTLPVGARIVDIGCGAGGTLHHLEQSGRYRLVGVDRSDALLAEAAKHLHTARLMPGDAEKIPLSTESADLLLCECVLSIVENKGASLAEFARVVKEGGYLVISDLFRKSSLEMAASPSTVPGREDLLQLLATHGFSLLLWENHDRLLKEFVVRMIFSGRCLPAPWGYGCSKGDLPAMGYFLLVARKERERGGRHERNFS